jgi:hypothetical protein
MVPPHNEEEDEEFDDEDEGTLLRITPEMEAIAATLPGRD